MITETLSVDDIHVADLALFAVSLDPTVSGW